MCDPNQELGNAFDTIGNAGQSIINGINKTADNFLRNPLPVIETVVLTSMGVPAPIASAAVGAANGGKLDQIAIAAAVSYAGQQAGAAAGDQVSPIEQNTLNQMGPQYADEALIKQIVTSASGTAAATALKNKNASLGEILTSGLSGAVNTLVTQQLKDQGFNAADTKTIAAATSAATNAILKGKDVGLAIGNSVLATTLSNTITEQVGTLTKNSETIQGLKTSYQSLVKDATAFFTNNKIEEKQTQAEADYKAAQAAQKDYLEIKPQFDAAYADYTKNKNNYENYAQYLADSGFQGARGGNYYLFQNGTWVRDAGGNLIRPPTKDTFLTAANDAVATINKLAPTVQAANDAATKYQGTLALLTPLQDEYTKQYGTPLSDYEKQIGTLDTENAGLAKQLGENVTKYEDQIKTDAADITKQIAGDAAEKAKAAQDERAVAAGFENYAAQHEADLSAQKDGFTDYAEKQSAAKQGITDPQKWADYTQESFANFDAISVGFKSAKDQQAAADAGFASAKNWAMFSSLSEGAQKDYADLVAKGTDVGNALTLAKAFDNPTPVAGPGTQVAEANTGNTTVTDAGGGGGDDGGGNGSGGTRMVKSVWMPGPNGTMQEHIPDGNGGFKLLDPNNIYVWAFGGPEAGTPTGNEYEISDDPNAPLKPIEPINNKIKPLVSKENPDGTTTEQMSDGSVRVIDKDGNILSTSNLDQPAPKFESEDERLKALHEGITDPADWTKFKEAQAKVALSNTPTTPVVEQPTVPNPVQPTAGSPTVTGGGAPTVGNLPSTGGGSPATTGEVTPTTTGGGLPTTGGGTPTTTGGGLPSNTGDGLPNTSGGSPVTTGGNLPGNGGDTNTTNPPPTTVVTQPVVEEPTKPIVEEPTKPTVPTTPTTPTTPTVPTVPTVPAAPKTPLTQAAPTAQSTTPSPLLTQKLDSSPQFLTSKAPTSSKSILKSLKHLYDSLEGDTVAPLAIAAAASQAPEETEKEQESKFMATGGSTNDTGFSLNPPVLKEYKPTVLAAAPVMEQKSRLSPLRKLSERQSAMPHDPYAMAKGGVLDKYADAIPAGHKPEFITGLTGYYAQGKGTGQSDDIDAMLHENDYVCDADLVAALGDGSSKAGAQALEKFRRSVKHNEYAVGGTPVPAKIADGEYVLPGTFVAALGNGDVKAGTAILEKMREAIREHKRSAPANKIPPKAKSPLQYAVAAQKSLGVKK